MIYALMILVFLADQVTKYWIAGNESLQNIVLIENFFHIRYAENTGMAWSMLSGHPAFLAVVSAVAIGAMLYYLLFKNPDRLTKIALALMIGGAAGNLYDRMILSYVRDFLDFYIFGYDFPIFNVADAALCVGVFFLLIAMIKEEKKDGKQGMES